MKNPMASLIIKRKGRFASLKSIAKVTDTGVYLVEVKCIKRNFYSVMNPSLKLQFVTNEALNNYCTVTSLSKNVKYGISDTNLNLTEQLEEYANKQIDAGMVFSMEEV